MGRKRNLSRHADRMLCPRPCTNSECRDHFSVAHCCATFHVPMLEQIRVRVFVKIDTSAHTHTYIYIICMYVLCIIYIYNVYATWWMTYIRRGYTWQHVIYQRNCYHTTGTDVKAGRRTCGNRSQTNIVTTVRICAKVHMTKHAQDMTYVETYAVELKVCIVPTRNTSMQMPDIC